MPHDEECFLCGELSCTCESEEQGGIVARTPGTSQLRECQECSADISSDEDDDDYVCEPRSEESEDELGEYGSGFDMMMRAVESCASLKVCTCSVYPVCLYPLGDDLVHPFDAQFL